jgi:RND family efflux transporter MFP subunit
MAVWKQSILALILLVAAAAAWLRFVPGAPEIASSWGMGWAAAAINPEGARPADGGMQQQRRGGGQAGPVVAAQVASATINDRLSAIGTGRANASVAVKPYTAGRLTDVLAEPGARVERGAVLAKIDADAEQITLERARIALEDAMARAERTRSLRSSNAVTAVQVTEAELTVQNAQLALRDAELALERRQVIAPISGVVGILPVEAGNTVTSDTVIATIDDRSSILVDFWVPERYTTQIKQGMTVNAASVARPGDTFEGTVSAVDNRLDEASRTMLVQARIANPDDRLRAGMSFQVSMRFPGDTFPAVDPLAIQWGNEGSYVWVLRDGTARRTPVRVIQRNTDTVLVEGDLDERDQVVTEGVHLVRDGAKPLVAGNDIAPAQAAKAAVSGAGG